MTADVEKFLYTAACVVAVVLSIASVALVAVQSRNEARVGLRTTAAVCSLRSYYEGQAAQSTAFLQLTPEERVAKYGSLGDVPTSVIRAGLVKEREVVAALRPVRCP